MTLGVGSTIMAGQVLTVFERGELDFGTPNESAPEIGDVPLTQNVEIAGYRQIVMLIRVHDASGIEGPDGQIVFKLKSVLPAPDDPGQFFRGVDLLASQAVSKSDMPGTLYRVPVAANAGAFASLFAAGLQSATSTGSLRATISVVLSLKA